MASEEGVNKGPGGKSHRELHKEGSSRDRKDGWDGDRYKMSFLASGFKVRNSDRAIVNDSAGCALTETPSQGTSEGSNPPAQAAVFRVLCSGRGAGDGGRST